RLSYHREATCGTRGRVDRNLTSPEEQGRSGSGRSGPEVLRRRGFLWTDHLRSSFRAPRCGVLRVNVCLASFSEPRFALAVFSVTTVDAAPGNRRLGTPNTARFQ